MFLPVFGLRFSVESVGKQRADDTFLDHLIFHSLLVVATDGLVLTSVLTAAYLL